MDNADRRVVGAIVALVVFITVVTAVTSIVDAWISAHTGAYTIQQVQQAVPVMPAPPPSIRLR